jgi:hypothetical protein
MFNLNDTILIIFFLMYLIRILDLRFMLFLIIFHVLDLLFVQEEMVQIGFAMGNFNDGSFFINIYIFVYNCIGVI